MTYDKIDSGLGDKPTNCFNKATEGIIVVTR